MEGGFVASVAAALEAGTCEGLRGTCAAVEGGLRFEGVEPKRELVVAAGEVDQLNAAFGRLETAAARSDFVANACRAYLGGAGDVPATWAAAQERLMPQLWSLEKIVAKGVEIGPEVVLPHCSLNGETPVDPTAHDCAVVVVFVCDSSSSGSSKTKNKGAGIETPVLSRDLVKWHGQAGAPADWVAVLRVAMANLRDRTKAAEEEAVAYSGSSVGKKRWDHHPSGCGSTVWRDRFDSARCALLPSVVAKRKREDGGPEPGAHVAVFASRSCCLATTARNPIGLCYLGDVLHTKMKVQEPVLVSTQAYRLVKVKPSPARAAKKHPLVQKAGEGVTWYWIPYKPAASSGEFSVPTTSDEVESLLAAIESGSSQIPVFGETDDARRQVDRRNLIEAEKAKGNDRFAAGAFRDALGHYQAAVHLGERAVEEEEEEGKNAAAAKRTAAVLHANASAALLKLKQGGPQEEKAQALKHAMRATELDPTYAKAHARLAAAFTALGDPSAARDARQAADTLVAAEKAEKAARREADLQRRRDLEDRLAAAQAAKQALAATRKNALREKTNAAAKISNEEDTSSAKRHLPRTTITLTDDSALEALGFVPGLTTTPSMMMNNNLGGLGMIPGLSSTAVPSFGAAGPDFSPYIATNIH